MVRDPVGIVASKLDPGGADSNKDKASFIVSGRRTYIDLLARPIIKQQFERGGQQWKWQDIISTT